jgi:hypothetical protein
MWKATVPMKVKIFCWMCFRGRIEVTEELQKKGWPGELGCVYCREQETADHLIFSYAVSSFMWWCVARMQGWSDRPNSFEDFLYKSFGNAVGNGSYIGWVIFGAIAWAIWNGSYIGWMSSFWPGVCSQGCFVLYFLSFCYFFSSTSYSCLDL